VKRVIINSLNCGHDRIESVLSHAGEDVGSVHIVGRCSCGSVILPAVLDTPRAAAEWASALLGRTFDEVEAENG
jgi:hypothetical protein